MGKPNVSVVNLESDLVPSRDNAGDLVQDREVAVGDAAGAMIVAALHANTDYVLWTLTGADARVRFDGRDPTGTVGHFIENGDWGIWSRRRAESAKWIRDDTTNAELQITELMRP